MPSPDLPVLFNGKPLVPGVVMHSMAMAPAGYVVEVFRGEVRMTSKWFDLKPGMMVELEILQDGTINVEYDGPVRAPAPGSHQPRRLYRNRKHTNGWSPGSRKESGAILWPCPSWRQIKSLNKELEHTKGVAQKE